MSEPRSSALETFGRRAFELIQRPPCELAGRSAADVVCEMAEHAMACDLLPDTLKGETEQMDAEKAKELAELLRFAELWCEQESRAARTDEGYALWKAREKRCAELSAMLKGETYKRE